MECKFHYHFHKNTPFKPILPQVNLFSIPISISLRSILTLPCHLRLGLPSCLVPQVFHLFKIRESTWSTSQNSVQRQDQSVKWRYTIWTSWLWFPVDTLIVSQNWFEAYPDYHASLVISPGIKEVGACIRPPFSAEFWIYSRISFNARLYALE